MKLVKYIFALTLFFAINYTTVQAQSRVVLNASGGTASTDDILVIISPTGQFNVFYKGFRQNFGHKELPDPVPITYSSSDYGSAPVVRFKFSLPGNTTGSTSLTAINSCSTTTPTGSGTPSDPERTILTGTVTSPLTNQIYYLTCTFSWSGGAVMNMDYVVRAPFNLTQSETLHLYIDEDAYAGDDDYGFAFDGTTNGEYVGVYRVNDNCAMNGNASRIKTFFYGYKVGGSFASTYSGSYSYRVSAVNSSSNLTLARSSTDPTNRDYTCVDNGIAVHVTFPTFTTAGQSATRRIVLAMSSITSGATVDGIKTNNLNYFNSLVVTDPPVPGVTSSPVSVQFESATFEELEGDDTHQATAIKVKVKAMGSGSGILGTDQTVGLSVTGGSAVQNTDYSYQNAFVIPAGNYSTEKTITVNCVSVIGNLIVQGDRTISMKLIGDSCNDLIGLGTQSTATYKIVDDDTPTVSLTKLSDLTSCGTSAGVFRINLSKAISTATLVSFDMTGSTATPSDFSAMSPANWFSTATTGAVTVPANTASYDVALTPTANNIIGNDMVMNARISSAVTNSINATIASDPADRVSVNIVDCDNTAANKLITVSASPTTINQPPLAVPNAAAVTVRLPANITSAQPIRVSFTRAGTAVYATDYTLSGTAPDGYVDIPAGVNYATFNVDAIANSILKGDETVVLTPSAPEGFAVTGIPNILIKDGTDTPANRTLTLTANPSTIWEKDATPNQSVITAQLPDGITSRYVVNVDLDFSGTAVLNTDYTSSSALTTIPAGGDRGSITLTALKDNIMEGDETATITTAVTSSYLTAAAPVSVTIKDYTPGDIIVEKLHPVGNVGLPENSATDGVFRIRFKNPDVYSTNSIRIRFTLTGTAQPGVDYQDITKEVILPAYNSSVEVPIRVLNNFIVQGNRTLILTVTDVE